MLKKNKKYDKIRTNILKMGVNMEIDGIKNIIKEPVIFKS